MKIKPKRFGWIPSHTIQLAFSKNKNKNFEDIYKSGDS